MNGLPARKKRGFSSVYKIYRRLRFIRHKRRSLRETQRLLRREEEEKRREVKESFREHAKTEKQLAREKARLLRTEQKQWKREQHKELRLKKKELSEEIRLQAEAKHQRLLADKRRLRSERRRLLRYFLRNRIRDFFLSFRTVTPGNIGNKFRAFRQSLPARKKFAMIAVNSTVLYLGSYLFLFLLGQAVTVIAAGFFDYPTIVYYYEVYFNISPTQWYHDSVKTIFSAGPLFNLVVGVSFLIIYHNIREAEGIFKLFFLWGFLHAVNMLFGAMLVGTLFETGVGHVISWMYVMDTGRLMYSVVSIFFLVLAGLLTTRSFLISGNAYLNEVNHQNRSFLMIPQVFLPYILGNVILILLRQPKFIYYDTFIGLTMILCILPVMITYRSYHELYFDEEEKRLRISWPGVFTLVLLLLFFRVVLAQGLRFG